MTEVVTRPNAQGTDVVLAVCPCGEHGGGDVLAGIWVANGGATCGCGQTLVPIESALDVAKAAVAEVVARHAASVAGVAGTPVEAPVLADAVPVASESAPASVPAPSPAAAIVVTTPEDGDSPRSLLGDQP